MESKNRKRGLSYRQNRTIELWLRYGRKSKARALREAGYSEAVARQPHKVFGSPLVIEELERRGHGSRGIENNKKPELKYVELKPKGLPPETFEQLLAQLTPEKIQDIKERMDALPGKPIRWQNNEVEVESTREYSTAAYVPRGSVADIFGAEAKYPYSYPRPRNLSAM
jgi:hypothetical protein